MPRLHHSDPLHSTNAIVDKRKNFKEERGKRFPKKVKSGSDSDSDTFMDAQDKEFADLNDENESEGDEEDISVLKSSLANVPFGKLAEMKKIGIGLYNEQRKLEATEKMKKKEKRKKSEPAEMSSKIPVSRFRMVVPPEYKLKARDPRFQDTCGHFNEDLFEKSYNFIDDIGREEHRKTIETLRKEKDPEQYASIQKAAIILKQQLEDKKRREIKRTLKSSWKKKEASLVERGKNPFFLKKSMERQLLMLEKYKELKSSNKLDKYLAKKMAKNAKKDRVYTPFRRRLPPSSDQ